MIIELTEKTKELCRFKCGNHHMILNVIESAKQQYKVVFVHDGRANGYVKFSTRDEAMEFINKRIENDEDYVRQHHHDMQTDAIFANSRV